MFRVAIIRSSVIPLDLFDTLPPHPRIYHKRAWNLYDLHAFDPVDSLCRRGGIISGDPRWGSVKFKMKFSTLFFLFRSELAESSFARSSSIKNPARAGLHFCLQRRRVVNLTPTLLHFNILPQALGCTHQLTHLLLFVTAIRVERYNKCRTLSKYVNEIYCYPPVLGLSIGWKTINKLLLIVNRESFKS